MSQLELTLLFLCPGYKARKATAPLTKQTAARVVVVVDAVACAANARGNRSSQRL